MSITQEAPAISNVPVVDFDKQKFDSLIDQKGYTCLLESSISCPCRQTSAAGHQPLSSCLNCGGTGWVFINKTKTKMIMHSMNNNTKFSEWSEEKIGTVSITTKDDAKLGFMDKVTVLDGESYYTETVHIKEYEGKLFSFVGYDIVSLLFCFLFKGPKEKLTLLREGIDFTVETNKIVFNKKFKKTLKLDEKFNIGIRYSHRPVFHVIDLPRDVMVTDIRNGVSVDSVKMPIHGIGRRAHYIAAFENLYGERLFDNSTIKSETC